MFKQRSKLLFITIFLESIFSVWTLFYFNYLDRLNYQESIIKTVNYFYLNPMIHSMTNKRKDAI